MNPKTVSELNHDMCQAAKSGHLEIVKVCKEWGATEFDCTMKEAAESGHFEIVKVCREWSKNFYGQSQHYQEAVCNLL